MSDSERDLNERIESEMVVGEDERVTADGNVVPADRGLGADPLPMLRVQEQALARVRTALAELQQVPAAGLEGNDDDLHDCALGDLYSLERSLSNTVSQKRGED